MRTDTKFTVGNKRFPVSYELEKDRIVFYFKYNPPLQAEIKAMEGAKYHGYDEVPRKLWSVKDTLRNRFQIAYLSGDNPYSVYDKPLIDFEISPRFNKSLNKEVSPYPHQADMVRHFITRRYCNAAGEMGTGKSLAFLLAMEKTQFEQFNTEGTSYVDGDRWWLIGPTSALMAVTLEIDIWGFKDKPLMFTYEGLRSLMANWPKGKKAPRRVVFDECSRVKTPTAQRSQAALALANGVREDWGDKGMVLLASGTPAPKSPADWWHTCEIACPGFIREGSYKKFKDRLAIIVQRESIVTGGVYPHLVTWRDDPAKCHECGELKEHPNHDPQGMVFDVKSQVHPYKESINEIRLLYERMQGLVMVKLKKECLSFLPDKIFKELELTPSQSTLNAAKIIAKASRTTIQALTLLRELSDGFQYKDEVIGTQPCEYCKGVKQTLEWVGPTNTTLDPNLVPAEQWQEWLDNKEVRQEMVNCPTCDASGVEDKIKRNVIMIATPKQDAYIDYLEEMEEINNGRAVSFAGFTGSIDRMVDIAHQNEWTTIRVDGRGWHVTNPKNQVIDDDPLKLFQISQMESSCWRTEVDRPAWSCSRQTHR